MRVIYFSQEEVSSKPPCVSEILILKDLGVDVRVLTTYCNDATRRILNKRGIPITMMRENDRSQKKTTLLKRVSGTVHKLNNFIHYDVMIRRYLRKNYNRDTVLWLGTEKSLVSYPHIWRKYKPIIQNALEFYETNSYQRKMKRYISLADITTACEVHRAQFMTDRWHLKSAPYILPNKPYLHPRERNLPGSTVENRKRIQILDGKKIILYQGIITKGKNFAAVASALAELERSGREKEPWWFVIIGTGDMEALKEAEKIYSRVMYLGFVPAPLHLEITSHARICYAYYETDTLNRRYCAPNKIYEAAGFGIPVLANNAPGLISTVEASGSGICVDFHDSHVVADAIRSIDGQYDKFSKSSTSFYDGTDNKKTIQEILNALLKKMQL